MGSRSGVNWSAARPGAIVSQGLAKRCIEKHERSCESNIACLNVRRVGRLKSFNDGTVAFLSATALLVGRSSCEQGRRRFPRRLPRRHVRVRRVHREGNGARTSFRERVPGSNAAQTGRTDTGVTATLVDRQGVAAKPSSNGPFAPAPLARVPDAPSSPAAATPGSEFRLPTKRCVRILT